MHAQRARTGKESRADARNQKSEQEQIAMEGKRNTEGAMIVFC